MSAAKEITRKIIVLPVVEGQGPGGHLAQSILLDADTGKPVSEFTDEFWRELRDHALFVICNAYQDLGCVSFVVVLLSIPLSMCTAMQPLYRATVISFLSVGWLIHSGLWSLLSPRLKGRFVAPFFYDAVVLLCGLLSLMYGFFVQSVLLLLLGGASFYCFPFAVVPIVPELPVETFIRAVNVNCCRALKGYKIAFASQAHPDGKERKCLIFQPWATKANEEVNDLFVPVPHELRVYPFRNFAYLCNSQDECTENHSLLGHKICPPEISPVAWDSFVADLSTDISLHDKVANRIPLLMAMHVVVSLGYYAAYKAINFLLPLHVTMSLIKNLLFRNEMKRKFLMIDKLGCSTFGSKCRVSYHCVRWFSHSDDYVLFASSQFSDDD